MKKIQLEMFYLNSTLNFEIPPVLVFQLEVYYKVDRLLAGLIAQQKGNYLMIFKQIKHLYSLLNSSLLKQKIMFKALALYFLFTFSFLMSLNSRSNSLFSLFFFKMKLKISGCFDSISVNFCFFSSFLRSLAFRG